jgi:hypothetical protein
MIFAEVSHDATGRRAFARDGNPRMETSARPLNDPQDVDYSLWFSDTDVRTPSGWRYVFGQASRSLP